MSDLYDSSAIGKRTQNFITFSYIYFSSYGHITFKYELKVDVTVRASAIHASASFQLWIIITFMPKLYFFISCYCFEEGYKLYNLLMDLSCYSCYIFIKYSLEIVSIQPINIVYVDCINRLTWFVCIYLIYTYSTKYVILQIEFVIHQTKCHIWIYIQQYVSIC